jgi:hypothetical protein
VSKHSDELTTDWFGIGACTAGNIVAVLLGWHHNAEGVPAPICGESDGTQNISDIDVWMWLKKLSPKSRPTNATLRVPLISLFSEPGRWIDLVDTRECLTPQGDTLRSSITSTFPIVGSDTSTIMLAEIARWLARCGGLTPDHVLRVEAYVMCFLSKEVCNPAALEGQQQMKKAVTRAAKRAHTMVSVTMVTANQVDRELASA